MAKIAMLLPHPDMLEAAVYAANLYHLELSTLAILEYGTTAGAAKAAVKNGADIIIARGGQAVNIAEHVDVPVVEIKVTTYEICLLLEQARKLSDKEQPFIALTGPDNMFVNMDIALLESRYSIRFRPYLFHGYQKMEETAQMAIDDGADVIIGGPDVYKYCQIQKVPCLRTMSGRESIIEACRIASLLANTLDKEKAYSASLNMLLDHTYSGIIHTDTAGRILRANHFVEHLLFMDSHSMEGQPVWMLIPGISETMLRLVCDKQKEIHSQVIKYGRSEFLVSLSPILAEGSCSGVIISFHEGLYMEQYQEQQKAKLLRKGYVAKHTFDTMIARSPQMQKLCEQARRYAAFQFPILISGPSGTEKQVLAECIHNSSNYKEYPFIRFNCNGFNPEEVDQILFGKSDDGEKSGLIYNGPCTLYLHEISNLSRYAQYHLLIYIQDNAAAIGAPYSRAAQKRIRFIASSRYSLFELVKKGQFRRDLYYAISVMTLELLPLKERREDIMGWVDYHLKGLQENYGRYLRLTKDAQQFLQAYDWPGNLLELRTVCNRILVNCEKYYIDARDIEKQLDFSSVRQETVYEREEKEGAESRKEQIIRILHKYEGNREAAAAELHISTTTLWRWMKTYRIPKEEGKPARK